MYVHFFGVYLKHGETQGCKLASGKHKWDGLDTGFAVRKGCNIYSTHAETELWEKYKLHIRF